MTYEGQGASLGCSLFLPGVTTAATQLLVCLPGGGVSRHYWDLADGNDRTFSFARAMANRGHIVATIDPPGVGESTRPDDGFSLTLGKQLPLLAAALADLRGRTVDGVTLGSLPMVGVGHSAGAMFTIALQARFRPYRAIAPLCFGTLGLPQYLKPAYVALLEHEGWDPARVPEYARIQFRTGYFRSGEREGAGAAGRALSQVCTDTVAAVAIQAMTPGNIADDVAKIRVPVFTAQGERDITGPAHLFAEAFVNCPSLSQTVVEGAGHHVFVVPAAQQLFAKFAKWLEDLS